MPQINASCTVYHESYNSETKDYEHERVFIPECFWDSSDKINKFQYGDENSYSGMIMIWDVEEFVKVKAYSRLSDTSCYWTLTQGDKIVKGEVPESVLYKDLETLYDDCLTVQKVNFLDLGSKHMHHLEVGGK